MCVCECVCLFTNALEISELNIKQKKQTQTDSLDFAAVFGFLQVLVQFDDPLLVLLLLDPSHLLQFAGPLVFQHLPNTDNVKHQRTLKE